MIVFGFFISLLGAQYSMAKQAAEAQLLVGSRADESLSVSLNQGTVTVRNNGPTAAVITYYIGVNGGGHQTIAALSPQLAVAPRGTVTFSVNSSFDSVGVITSYGNIWWSI